MYRRIDNIDNSVISFIKMDHTPDFDRLDVLKHKIV